MVQEGGRPETVMFETKCVMIFVKMWWPSIFASAGGGATGDGAGEGAAREA